MAVFEGADPEFGEAFRAYRNYFEDLARYIQDLHGYSDRGWPRSSLVDGVHDHVLAHPGVKSLNRRKLSGAEEADRFEHHLRKSWSDLRRSRGSWTIPTTTTTRRTPGSPAQAYYAIYNAVLAVMTAGGRPRVQHDHAAALKAIGNRVSTGLLPAPWHAYCTGCPQTGSELVSGIQGGRGPRAVPSRPRRFRGKVGHAPAHH